MVPFSVQDAHDSPSVVYFRGDSLQTAKRDSMWKSQIGTAHSHGIKVFFKSHLWLHKPSPGKWRSDVFPKNDKNWVLWKKTYRQYILLNAKIAEDNNVEMFCIGAELSRLTLENPEFWISLIKEAKSIYSAPITYAANWHDEYEKITFWDQLDFIGTQAYFPLTRENKPSILQISQGWNKYIPDFRSVSSKFNKKILFTEMGYKSTSNSASEPWPWVEDDSADIGLMSYETQSNCFKAFF
jgi:hypothetical protein